VVKGLTFQHYAQVGERLNISTLYTNGQKVKNINIIHKWSKGQKYQHYTQAVKRCPNST
jgi:hypothetical protein